MLDGVEFSGHRRDVVAVIASARWRGCSRRSTQYFSRNLTHWLICTQITGQKGTLNQLTADGRGLRARAHVLLSRAHAAEPASLLIWAIRGDGRGARRAGRRAVAAGAGAARLASRLSCNFHLAFEESGYSFLWTVFFFLRLFGLGFGIAASRAADAYRTSR